VRNRWSDADARAVRRATLHALRRTSDPALVASLRRRLDALRAQIAREQRALDALRRSTGLARVEVDLDTTRAGTIAPRVASAPSASAKAAKSPR